MTLGGDQVGDPLRVPKRRAEGIKAHNVLRWIDLIAPRLDLSDQVADEMSRRVFQHGIGLDNLPQGTYDWRKAEELRLEAEREELERREKQHAQQVAAETAHLAQRQQELDDQAAEQDAFTAAAEALEAGLITPDQPTTFRNPSADPRAQSILGRIQAAKPGYRRFIQLMQPIWTRMQSRADEAAKTKVEKDRAEIETAWKNLGEITRNLLPNLAPITQPREAVARVIAWWKIKQGEDDRRDKDGQQRERDGGWREVTREGRGGEPSDSSAE